MGQSRKQRDDRTDDRTLTVARGYCLYGLMGQTAHVLMEIAVNRQVNALS